MSVLPYDVIVIGGGHAGCEAALASARLGARTAVLTSDPQAMACMPCNPSIGGIAKSHLVYELDALGGEMARNTDYTAVQFRVLNTSKGPAVQATRAQCDKHAYSKRMRAVIALTPNIAVIPAHVVDIRISQALFRVQSAEGVEFLAKAVVVTAGTALRGTIHIGERSWAGGGHSRPADARLSLALQKLDIRMARFKTGTPPRLRKSTIDYDRMEIQPGMDQPTYFSWAAERDRGADERALSESDYFSLFHVEQRLQNPSMFHVEQSPGNPNGSDAMFQVEQDLRQQEARLLHVEQSPCPKPAISPATAHPSLTNHLAIPRSHCLHTGASRDNIEVSPSLLALLRPWRPGSDSLPCYLTHTTPHTHEIIRSNLSRSAMYGGFIEGTGVRYCPSVEDKIVKFADKTAHHVFIEPEGRNTDLVYPNGISNSLPESVQADLVHSIPGLENAEIVDWAYAIEYDFADPTQLTHSLECKNVENLFIAGQVNGTTGYEEAAALGFIAGINAARKALNKPEFILDRTEAYIGVLIDDLVTKGTNEPYRMFTSRAEHRLVLRQDNARFRLLNRALELGIANHAFLHQSREMMAQIAQEIQRLSTTRHADRTLQQLLSRPGASYKDLPGALSSLPSPVIQQVEIHCKYHGYIDREERAIAKARCTASHTLPPGFDFSTVQSLRFEAREKLTRIRPPDLAAASRIPGITPADIAVLSISLHRR